MFKKSPSHKLQTISYKLNSRRGFSLLEVIVVMAIFIGIIPIVGSFQKNLNSIHQLVDQKLRSRSDVIQTLQIFSTELRSAGISGAGAYPIQSAGTTSLTFFSDVDKNGVVDRVRYFSSSTRFYKGIVVPTGEPLVYTTSTEIVTTVMENLVPTSSVPLFRYYDSAYTGSESPLTYPIARENIRVVQISFYADIKPTAAPVPLYFSETITVRNLRSN